MQSPSPRLAVRALILEGGRLLLVNAYPDGRSDLWCAPGGGVERGLGLPENLAREVHEETGLTVTEWGDQLYDVTVDFSDMANRLRVVVFSASRWEGAISIDDPDGIVEDVRFCNTTECHSLLAQTFLWVREPLEDWLQHRAVSAGRYTYRAEGQTLTTLRAVRV